MSGVHEKYNVEINSKGYVIRGAPNAPAYQKSVVQTGIERFSISDVEYSDFSGQGLFYVAQTDWSAGFKDEKKWRDDGKYWYSTNIDTFSDIGAIKLAKQSQEHIIADGGTADILCGINATVGGNNTTYFGTDEDSGTGKAYVGKASSASSTTWSDITDSDFDTNRNSISQLYEFNDKLWILTIGGDNDNAVNSYDDSSITDHTAGIIAVVTGSNLRHGRACIDVAGSLYVACKDTSPVGSPITYIISTNDDGSTWASEYEFTREGSIIDMNQYNSDIFYLFYDSGSSVLELHSFEISSSTDTIVEKWNNITTAEYGVGGRMIFNKFGKLIITVGEEEIYGYDGSSLTRIYKRDEAKDTRTKYGYLKNGGISFDNKIWWGNLVYDGEYFYNYSKDYEDNTDEDFYPIFSYSNTKVWVTTEEPTKTYRDSTTFKPTLANNYLVSNRISVIPTIDKLLNSFSIIFDELNSGESIRLDYSIDNRETWTSTDAISYSNSGDQDISLREIIIPESVVFNDIWYRLHLAGTATSPVVRDIVMSYRPMPDYKSKWSIRLNTSNRIKLLNGQTEERDGNELNAELWNLRTLKEKITLADVDYVDCELKSALSSTDTSALVTSTKRFPRQGRIRAVSGGVSEEMYYTSAQTGKILGITRGVRGTKARSYLSGQTLKNDYDVYIDNVRTDLTFTDENKTESATEVLLIEA